jgi:hypothetical protein
MNLKYILLFFLAIGVIFGWNALLIQRDDAMFKAYYKQQAMENLKQLPSTEIK